MSGPSGVGKGTVIDKVLPRFRDLIESVSANTRAARPDEVEGEDYSFVSREQFERMIAADEFYEWANVHDELKGTPKREIRKALEGGVDMVLELDYQGALAIKQKEPSAVLVFIAPPSWEELERRLRGRETESPESLQCRLETALTELKNLDRYDYVIVNDAAERAAEKLAAVVVAERCRRDGSAPQELVGRLLDEARETLARSE